MSGHSMSFIQLHSEKEYQQVMERWHAVNHTTKGFDILAEESGEKQPFLVGTIFRGLGDASKYVTLMTM